MMENSEAFLASRHRKYVDLEGELRNKQRTTGQTVDLVERIRELDSETIIRGLRPRGTPACGSKYLPRIDKVLQLSNILIRHKLQIYV